MNFHYLLIIPLILLAVGSIFIGYIIHDMFIGLGLLFGIIQ